MGKKGIGEFLLAQRAYSGPEKLHLDNAICKGEKKKKFPMPTVLLAKIKKNNKNSFFSNNSTWDFPLSPFSQGGVAY